MANQGFPHRLTRRTAIGALATTTFATTTTLQASARQDATPEGHTHTSATPIASPAAVANPADGPRPEVTAPEVISSSDGVLNATLNAYITEVEMGVGHPVTTYTYNGVVPGQTWEVSPGDTMRIHLANDLPEIPEGVDPHDIVRPHAWTTTNLHTHGLHVSPEGNSDNVFLEIGPGKTFDFEIDIPEDHTGGLYWYHPHKHGAVCQQVRAGMAGALIVRGEIDEVPEIKAAKEQVLVFQDIELDDNYVTPEPIPHPDPNQAFFPRSQYYYTVNGQLLPKITMYPGEVQRWRMLNAAEGKFMSLRIQDHDLNVVAWDGLTQHEPTAEPDVMMSPGNRVEALVKAGAPGTYEVVLTPGSSQHPDMPGMPHSDDVGQDDRSNELKIRPIMILEVTGDGPEMSLPTALPAYDPPIRKIVTSRLVRYTVERGPDGVEFLDFGVDGKPFHPDNAPYQMKLGTAEEWIVMNDSDPKYAEHAHAFHIHVNPFKVTSVNGEILEQPYWRDTMAISGRDGDWFSCQMNLDDFTGKFVHHCHVLSHEDLGMMEAVEVVE
jgi:FtsP/CotA-like multicopper oxidase with cupredoxin domain